MRHIFIFTSLLFLCGFSGVNYKSYTHGTSTKVHVLTLDPNEVSISAIRAQDLGYGLDTVKDMAQHFSAVAGINGGFFRLNQPSSTTGLPTGILKINDQWHGIAYKPRGAIGWDPATNEVLFDIVHTDSRLKIDGQNLPVHAMNKILEGNRASLLSDSYIDHVRMQDNIGLAIQDDKVINVYSTGTILIPKGVYIYNSGGILRQRVEDISVGSEVDLQILTEPMIDKSATDKWNKIPNIMGGGPLLIINKKIITDYTPEKISSELINAARARTAVGVISTGSWVFVVVEESIMNENSGMTIQELAQFMHDLGCVSALNLDGGGSSTMYIDSEILPMQMDILPKRPVADALLVNLKQQ